MPTSQSPDQTVDDVRPQSHDDLEPPQQRPRMTPVPKLQLLSVCVSRIAEPFAYTQIFPYVNQMVWELGVTDDPKKVGFYSGMVDSMFAFAQLLTVYGYGRLSDRIGRKPVVLFSVFGVALSSGLFGFSRSFAHMMAARSIAGLLSGYVAVLHSILGEITDDTNQAAAYPIYALCYPIGSLIGPLVGGALANPNENIPHLVPAFLHDLFDKYPYMLPSLAACAVAAMSFTFVLLFMNEFVAKHARAVVPRLPAHLTALGGEQSSEQASSKFLQSITDPKMHILTQASLLGSEQGAEFTPSASPTIERSRHSSTSTRVGEDELPKKCPSETDALLADPEDNEYEEPHNWTVRELLKLPELRQLYRSSVILSFLAEAYVVVFVLFSYTEIQYGGLGFEPAEIGSSHCPAPREADQDIPGCMSLWPIGYAIPPILNIIARVSSGNGQHEIGTAASAAIWTGIWIAQLLTKTACTAYAMNMVLARQSAPDQRALGATNGLNQLFMVGSRMFAPVTVSTIFALSSEHNWLGGHLVWVIMVALSILGWKACAWD
ncbi:major facilitator superfamily domain-containing protein [Rhizoctonia solani]|nr:major facilitator superfamily domain-containing protein [Rhizoctonia solani]